METFIEKIVLGKETEEDIWTELYEICDREHSNCNNNCPVYRLNGSQIPNTEKSKCGCDCFKNGDAMMSFIQSKQPPDVRTDYHEILAVIYGILANTPRVKRYVDMSYLMAEVHHRIDWERVGDLETLHRKYGRTIKRITRA